MIIRIGRYEPINGTGAPIEVWVDEMTKTHVRLGGRMFRYKTHVDRIIILDDHGNEGNNPNWIWLNEHGEYALRKMREQELNTKLFDAMEAANGQTKD